MRLDQMPLDDGEADSRSRHENVFDHRPHAREIGNRASGRPAPQMNTSVGNIWRTAIESGAFEDEDAAMVRGLDDLGGARLYDIKKKTGRILEAEIFANRHVPGNGPDISHHYLPRPPKAQPPGPKTTPLGDKLANLPRPQRVPSSAVRSAPHEARPTAKPTPNKEQQTRRAASSQVTARANLPAPSNVVHGLPLQPPPPEPARVIFKRAVKYTDRKYTPPVPAQVFLSAAKDPELGLFTLFVLNRTFCQWPITAWHNYITADEELVIQFRDGIPILTYDIQFKNARDLQEFLRAAEELRGGRNVVKPTAPDVSTKTNDPAIFEGTEDLLTSEKPASAAPLSVGSKQQPEPFLPPPSGSIPSERATSNDTNMGVSKADEWLIDFDAPVVSSDVVGNPTQRQSESSELLSTLEPWSYDEPVETASLLDSASQEDYGITDKKITMTLEQVIDLARNLLAVFTMEGKSGKTKKEMAETVEGVKQCFVEHYCLGEDSPLSVEDKAKFLEYIKLSQPATNVTNRRQYSTDELLAVRPYAKQPPAWLKELRFLPVPGKEVSQTSPVNEEASVTRDSSPYLDKSKSAMGWLMQKKSPSDEPVRIVSQGLPKAVEPRKTKLSGLKGSKWATPDATIKCENRFTGPGFEKNWPKGSDLHKLAQLDPEAQVTSCPNDVATFFFPPLSEGPSADEAIVAPRTTTAGQIVQKQCKNIVRKAAQVNLPLPHNVKITAPATMPVVEPAPLIALQGNLPPVRFHIS
ncbi:hypothetical protein QBC46DRAFT_309706 [Diplogelasinospora grovesii]|uniref:Uncharacterized protein n=1 Tax=Diplogelasinospora grovesii TaxID=303347 RepID=A0AAN6S750_9PEZI|nr:hypothetical protein QBC46DRAFT_309706 [Diplogelasinospora grovesii]